MPQTTTTDPNWTLKSQGNDLVLTDGTSKQVWEGPRPTTLTEITALLHFGTGRTLLESLKSDAPAPKRPIAFTRQTRTNPDGTLETRSRLSSPEPSPAPAPSCDSPHCACVDGTDCPENRPCDCNDADDCRIDIGSGWRPKGCKGCIDGVEDGPRPFDATPDAVKAGQSYELLDRAIREATLEHLRAKVAGLKPAPHQLTVTINGEEVHVQPSGPDWHLREAIGQRHLLADVAAAVTVQGDKLDGLTAKIDALAERLDRKAGGRIDDVGFMITEPRLVVVTRKGADPKTESRVWWVKPSTWVRGTVFVTDGDTIARVCTVDVKNDEDIRLRVAIVGGKPDSVGRPS